MFHRAFGPVEPNPIWREHPLMEQLVVQKNSRPDALKKYLIELDGAQLFTAGKIESLVLKSGKWRQGTPALLTLTLKGDMLVASAKGAKEEISLSSKDRSFSFKIEQEAMTSLKEAVFLKHDVLFSQYGKRLFFPSNHMVLPLNEGVIYSFSGNWCEGSLPHKPLMEHKKEGPLFVYGRNGGCKTVSLSQPKPQFAPFNQPTFVALSNERFLLKFGKSSFLVRPGDWLCYNDTWQQVTSNQLYKEIESLQRPMPLIVIGEVKGKGSNKSLSLTLVDPFRQFSENFVVRQ